MTITSPDLTKWTDQISGLIAENRRLRNKSDADDKTIHLLKEQYASVTGGIEDMIEDHRRVERDLTIEAHNAKVAYTQIQGLLDQAADLILQAARARIGDDTPAKMPAAIIPVLADGRMPEVSLS